VLQNNVHYVRAPGAHFTAALATLLAEAQTVLLDFQELLVKREQIARLSSPGGPELALSVREDFLEGR
jgi:hypothetical protein